MCIVNDPNAKTQFVGIPVGRVQCFVFARAADMQQLKISVAKPQLVFEDEKIDNERSGSPHSVLERVFRAFFRESWKLGL